MSTRDHLYDVVATLQPVIQGVSADRMDASTPCEDWDLRAEATHLLGTLEAMRRVGAGEPLDPDDPWGTNNTRLGDSWRTDLSALLRRYADAWSQPDAWEGDALDGAMPKQLVGDMGYVEVMLHGWDLAKASGQDVEFGDDAVDRALEIIDEIGEQGRSQGAFGAQVSVPDDAPAWDKVLAGAGRDPGWTP